MIWSIRTKMILTGLAAAIALVLLTGFAISAGNQVHEALETTLEKQRQNALSNLLRVESLRVALASFKLIHEQSSDALLENRKERLSMGLELLESNIPHLQSIASNPEQRGLVSSFTQHLDRFGRNVTDSVLPTLDTPGRAVPIKVQQSLDVYGESLDDIMGSLITNIGQEMSHSIKTTEETLSRFMRRTLFVFLATLSLLLLFLVITGLTITKPVVDITRAMQRLTAGEDNVDIPEPRTRDEIGRMARSVRIFRDYMKQSTERIKIESEARLAAVAEAKQAAEEANRLKSEFLNMVSHDLRTPLTSIRTFAEILRDTPDIEEEKREQFLKIIATESERLTRLINDLLDLAKIEAGRMEWNMLPIDLTDLVQDAISGLAPVYEKKGVRLEYSSDTKLIPTTGDPDRLTQVVVNLLSNAIKFAPEEEGHIAIKLSSEPQNITLSVSDNGPGIALKDQNLLFSEFRQVSRTCPEGKHEGTGLGLAICRRIIEHHGGRIGVKSAPGAGATFYFSLTSQGGVSPCFST